MPDIMDPTIDQMRSKLLTLDQVRVRLEATEPLTEQKFEAQQGVMFQVQDNWDEASETYLGTDLTDSYAVIFPGGVSLRLTKDALLEAGAKIGLPRKLQERTPSHLLSSQLNWWFSGKSGWEGRAFKAFTAGSGEPGSTPTLAAFGSGTISPFSNLQILDKMVEGLRSCYGSDAEILADYKFTHNLELTQVRLVVPGESRNVRGPGTADPSDLWSAGIQFRNSQLGLRPVSVDGYLFRWRCTNGLTDTLVTSGQYNRRSSGHEDGDVYEWARAAVDNVLGGLEQVLGGVEASTRIPVEQDVNLVMDDLFRQHRVPGRLRQEVIRNMAEVGGDLSMYSIMNAVTQVANDGSLSAASVDKLLRVGGHVAHAADKRCESCRRIMPED